LRFTNASSSLGALESITTEIVNSLEIHTGKFFAKFTVKTRAISICTRAVGALVEVIITLLFRDGTVGVAVVVGSTAI